MNKLSNRKRNGILRVILGNTRANYVSYIRLDENAEKFVLQFVPECSDIPGYCSPLGFRSKMACSEVLHCAENFVAKSGFGSYMIPHIISKICNEGYPICQQTASLAERTLLRHPKPTQNIRGFTLTDTEDFFVELSQNWCLFAKKLHPYMQEELLDTWTKMTINFFPYKSEPTKITTPFIRNKEIRNSYRN